MLNRRFWLTTAVACAVGLGAYLFFAQPDSVYSQVIHNRVTAALQWFETTYPFRRAGIPAQSTTEEAAVDELMKHYTELKAKHGQFTPEAEPTIGDLAAESDPDDFEASEGGVTWNSTSPEDPAVSPTPNVAPQTSHAYVAMPKTLQGESRVRSVEVLGEIGDADSVRASFELLLDPDPAVQRKAVLALHTANPAALYQEWREVAWHGNEDLANAVNAILPEVGGAVESVALADLASGETDRESKIVAAHLLGRVRSAAAIPLLTSYAWSNDTVLARTAAHALSETEDRSAMSALIDLTGHHDVDMRWEAADGLGKLGGPEVNALLQEIAAGFQETSPDVRRLAVSYLGEAGAPSSVPLLMDILQSNAGLRADAMYALSQITGIHDFPSPDYWYAWYEQAYEQWASLQPPEDPPVAMAEAPYLSLDPRVAPPTPDPWIAPSEPEQISAPAVTATEPAPQPSVPIAITPAPQPATAAAVQSPTAAEATPAPSTPTEPKTQPVTAKPSGRGFFNQSNLSPAEIVEQRRQGRTP